MKGFAFYFFVCGYYGKLFREYCTIKGNEKKLLWPYLWKSASIIISFEMCKIGKNIKFALKCLYNFQKYVDVGFVHRSLILRVLWYDTRKKHVLPMGSKFVDKSEAKYSNGECREKHDRQKKCAIFQQ